MPRNQTYSHCRRIIYGLHRDSFGVWDHLLSNLGISSCLGIICGRESCAALRSRKVWSTSESAVHRMGRINTKDFSAQSGATIRLAVRKLSGNSRFSRVSHILVNFRETFHRADLFPSRLTAPRSPRMPSHESCA